MSISRLQHDAEVLLKLDRYRCICDFGESKIVSFINPQDNVIISDVDNFLFVDSQTLINEEIARINHNVSSDEFKRINDNIDYHREEMNKIAEKYTMSLSINNEGYDLNDVLLSDERYSKLLIGLNQLNEEKLRKKILLNSILLEVNPKTPKIDYEEIYRKCKVNEEACRLIVDNVGEEKLFSKGLAASWYNPATEQAKIKRLRIYFGNLPILLIPFLVYPFNPLNPNFEQTSKIGTVVDIFGMFDMRLSLIGDDQAMAISDAFIRYGNDGEGLVTCLSSSPETAHIALREKMKVIESRKRAA